MKSFWMAVVAVLATVSFGVTDAEARRMGGGASIGKQAPIQRQATPPAQRPAQAAPAAPASAAAASSGSRWMAPMAGLAAGLGLAALASYMGFGEELASIMMMVLLAVVALVVIRMIMARRAGGQSGPAMAAAGAGGRTGPMAGGESRFQGLSSPGAGSGGGGASSAAPMGAGLAADTTSSLSIPAEFDQAGFLHNAKVYFVRLQASFDAGNTDDLREFTAPEVFAELKLQIDREKASRSHTDVITLDAEIVGFEQDAREYLVSVLFSGLIRESDRPDSENFQEVWNFSRPTSGSGGWVLSGIQQLSVH